jgi:glyoxylase I family protein
MGLKVEGCAPLIAVFDMPRSLAFYRDVLGFEVVARSGPGDDFGWGLLRLEGVELMLNTAYDDGERPAQPEAARVLAHDDVGLYFGCRDLDAAYAYLKSKGLELEPPAVSGYGMRQLWLKDPDGYNLCFQWRAA